MVEAEKGPTERWRGSVSKIQHMSSMMMVLYLQFKSRMIITKKNEVDLLAGILLQNYP